MKRITLVINTGSRTAYITRDYIRKGYVQTQIAQIDFKTGTLSAFRWITQAELLELIEAANYAANFDSVEEAIYRAGQITTDLIYGEVKEESPD